MRKNTLPLLVGFMIFVMVISSLVVGFIPQDPSATSTPEYPKNVGQYITFELKWSGGEPVNATFCKNLYGWCDGCPSEADLILCSNKTSVTGGTISCKYLAQESDDTETPFCVAYEYNNGSAIITKTMPSSSDPEGKPYYFYVNHAPNITSVSIIPNNASYSDNLDCNYIVAEKDGDDYSVTISWQINGTTIPNVASKIVNQATLGFKVGDKVSCTVSNPTDSWGFSRTQSITSANVTIIDPRNGLPDRILLTTSANTTAVNVGEIINLTATWNNSAKLNVTFCTGTDCSTCDNQSQNFLCENLTSQINKTTCSFTAKDAHLHENAFCARYYNTLSQDYETSSYKFLVNHAPTITSVRLEPFNASTDDTLFCNVSIVEVDGDSYNYSIDWYLNGTKVPAVANMTYVNRTNLGFLYNDTVYCNVSNPTDNNSFTRYMNVTSNILRIGRGLPLAVDVKIVSDIFNGTNYLYKDSANLICNFTILNYGNYSGKNYSVRWILNTTINGQNREEEYYAPNDIVMTHGNTLPGDMWRCKVTPYDGVVYGEPVYSPWVTITTDSGLGDNRAPYIINFTDNLNSNLSVGDDVIITVNWANINYNPSIFVYWCNSSNINRTGCNDKIYREVYFNASNNAEQFTLHYTLQEDDATNFTYWIELCHDYGGLGGEWTCSNFVTNNPYYYYGPNKPMGQMILNHKPVVANVSIINETGGSIFSDDSNLFCNSTITDVDGGNLTRFYKWYVKRNNIWSLAYPPVPSSPLLSNGRTLLGDEWICEVTPYDGKTYGNSVNSSAVKIINPATSGTPVIVNVSSNATYPVFVGSRIRFTVNWYDSDSSQVILYICNSTNINETGCIDRTLGFNGPNSTNPLTIDYIVASSDVDLVNYYVQVCDFNSSGVPSLCSNQYISNFTVDYAPKIDNVKLLAWKNGSYTTNYTEDVNLNCLVNYSDPDTINNLKNVSLKVEWFVKRESGEFYNYFTYYQPASLSPVINQSNWMTHGNIEYGDTWYCRVTPSDGYLQGAAVESERIFIGEAPKGSEIPNITKVVISNNRTNPVNVGEYTYFSIYYDQLPRRPVRVFICDDPGIIPNATISGCAGREFIPSTEFYYSNASPIIVGYEAQDIDYTNQSYYLWVCDDTNLTSHCSNVWYSAEHGNNLYVNHYPSVYNITLSPTSVNLSSNITCNFTYYASEFINDPLRNDTEIYGYDNLTEVYYYWYKNDIALNFHNNTLSNLTSYGIKKKDNISCEVFVVDALGLYAYNISTNLTIQNSPPVASPFIIPTYPNITTPLYCYPNATDIDNDSLNVSYQWFENNNLVEVLTSNVVYTSWLTNGSNWTCQVKVTDGESTIFANATVQIGYVPEQIPVVNISSTPVINLFETKEKGYYNVNSTIYYGQNITFRINWTDAENTTQRYNVYICNQSNIDRYGCVQGSFFCKFLNASYELQECSFNSTALTNNSNQSIYSFIAYAKVCDNSTNCSETKSLNVKIYFDKDNDTSYTDKDCDDNNSNYLAPYDGLIVNRNITLCKYSTPYYIANSDNMGLIKVAGNNITLDCNNTQIIGNNTGKAINVSNFNDITISNCLLQNYSTGISLYNITNLNLRNSAINSTNSSIEVKSSQFVKIENVKAVSIYDYGLYADSSILSYLNSITTGNMSVYLTNSTLNSINSTIINSTVQDTSTLNVSWYYDLVVYGSYGLLNNTIVNITDYQGNIIFRNVTNSSGQIPVLNLTEYLKNSTNTTYYSPYLVQLYADGYFQQNITINLTESITSIVNMVNSTDADGDGAYYTEDCNDTNPDLLPPRNNLYVNRSVTFCPGVFNINDTEENGVIIANTSNIIINCNNSTIIGNGSGIGFNISNFVNVTLLNCRIENYKHAILIDPSQATIENMVLSENETLSIINSNVTFKNLMVNKNNTLDISSSDVMIIDSILENTLVNLIDSQMSILNTTWNESNLNLYNSTLFKKWHFKLIITTPQSGVNISIIDAFNNTIFEGSTSGTTIPVTMLTEYELNTTGRTYYSNYTIYASAAGYHPKSYTLNLTNNTQISDSLSPISSGGGGGGTGATTKTTSTTGAVVFPVVKATCTDGIQNQGETGIDCGGPCAPCPTISPPPVVVPSKKPEPEKPAEISKPEAIKEEKKSLLWPILMFVIGIIILGGVLGYYLFVVRKTPKGIQISKEGARIVTQLNQPIIEQQEKQQVKLVQPVVEAKAEEQEVSEKKEQPKEESKEEVVYTDPLRSFIKKKLDQGRSFMEIKEALLLKGWEEDLVDNALKDVVLKKK